MARMGHDARVGSSGGCLSQTPSPPTPVAEEAEAIRVGFSGTYCSRSQDERPSSHLGKLLLSTGSVATPSSLVCGGCLSDSGKENLFRTAQADTNTA